MSFSFVDLADGSAIAGSGTSNGAMNLGPVSRVGAGSRNVDVKHSNGRMVVSTSFGVTVNDPSGANRTATLLAAVPSPGGPVVRIDGVVVDTTGRAIASHLLPGRVSSHRIEIEVPPNTTEANNHLLSNVIFSVLPE